MIPTKNLWFLFFLCICSLCEGFSATAETGCCPRKQNNGVVYVYYDILADPSEILAEYGCQSGKNFGCLEDFKIEHTRKSVSINI